MSYKPSKNYQRWALPMMALLLLMGCNQANEKAPSATAPAQVTQATTTPTNPTVAPTPTNLPTYVALIDPVYPPFEERNPDGTVGGMEVDIFNAIAKNQGFAVTYVPHEWSGIFDSMQQNNAKFVVSAVTAVPEAQEKTNLSKPYYTSPYRVATLDSAKLATWQDQPKIAISESEDSKNELPAMGVKPEQLVSYKTVFMAVGALAKGEVDAVLADSTVLQYNMKSEAYSKVANNFVSKALPADSTSDIVFAVDKASPDLLAKVNKGIDNLKASGELNKILQKYHQDITLLK